MPDDEIHDTDFEFMDRYEFCEISLWLNSSGFHQERIGEFEPDWSTERNYQTIVSWQSSFNGPDAWQITITFLGFIVGGISAGLLAELGKDIHSWIKGKINPVLEKKPNNCGVIVLKGEGFEFAISVTERPEEAMETLLALVSNGIQGEYRVHIKDVEIVLRNKSDDSETRIPISTLDNN